MIINILSPYNFLISVTIHLYSITILHYLFILIHQTYSTTLNN